MSRIPFDTRDLDQKVVSKVFDDLFRPLKTLSDQDSNALNALGARAARYRDLHDLQVEARKNQLPPAGSLSRGDIRAAFAIGLRRVADIGLMEAFRITGNVRFRLLSVDRRTSEWLAEQDLASKKAAAERDGLPQDFIGEMALADSTPNRQHLKDELIDAGAPGHYLTVRNDGKAFQWSTAYALYALLHKDPLKFLEGEPAVAGAGNAADALSAFARTCLVPESWVDLETLVRDGLEPPDYEVLSIFSAQGQYIGRVLRQRWHFGIIPDLFYTDEELIQGKVDLLAGKILSSQGWAKHAKVSVLCTEAVYVLRRDIVETKVVLPVPDMWTVHHVPVDDLVELKGVLCGRLDVATGNRPRTATWAINGDLCSLRAEDWNSTNQRYFSGIRWMEQSDLPLLYPKLGTESPQANKQGRTSFAGLRESYGLLPDSAVDLTERASRLMRIESVDAVEALTDEGALLRILRRITEEISEEDLEQAAQGLFEMLHAPGLGYEDYDLEDYDDIEDERYRLGERREQTLRMLPLFAKRFAEQWPQLARLGNFTLWFILRYNEGILDEHEDYFDDYGSDDVLIPLIILASAAVAGGRPEITQREAALVAINRWLEHGKALGQICTMASEFDRYERHLNHQARLMSRVGGDIHRQVDLRDRARAMGVAYVSDKVSSFAGENPAFMRSLEEGRVLMRLGAEIGWDRTAG